MAINDVLPLKAAGRDAIANLKYFWAPGHQQPNTSIDGFICIHYAAPLYSARINAIYLLAFDKVWLGSDGNEAKCKIYGGWVESLVLFNRLSTKVHEIFK